MTTWNPHLYSKFGSERTQPAIDLVARIHAEAPARIIDLGCGTGSSTKVLRERWPTARLSGLDSSPAMLDQAKASLPEIDWVEGSIEDWKPAERFDLIYANAAFQWLKQPELTVPTLLSFLTEGGVLAFQVPNNEASPYHQKILRVAESVRWRDLVRGAKNPLTYRDCSFYYELLADKIRSLDIWETRYIHVMESHQSIVDWVSGTGLGPYLEALPSEATREEFKNDLLAEYRTAYPVARNRKVLFPFNRQFVVAHAK